MTPMPAVSAVLLAAAAATTGSADLPDALLTVEERTAHRATSTWLETVDLVRALEALAPDRVRATTFGEPGAGRRLPLVVVADPDGALDPTDPRPAARPVVMVQAGIHPGEIDGKPAALTLLRDALLGRLEPDPLAGVTLLLVPVYNVDGHERVSPYNRPNQNGPVEGMGFRATPAGYDLNRDHLKLDSPEARGLAALLHRWNPHLHVDLHVTNGADHGWVLTWSTTGTPQLDPAPAAWLGEHLPRALAATEEAGWPTGPYVNLVDWENPAAGIDSWVGGPRYSTGYLTLRNRPSVLVEMNAHVPYADRVAACRAFLEALLAEAARGGAALVAAAAAADARTVAAGRPEAPAGSVVLEWRAVDTGDTVRLPLAPLEMRPSVVRGRPLPTWLDGPKVELEVPWIHRVVPAVTVARPRGYLVRPGWPQVERRLADHGLETRRLAAAVTVDGEELRVADPLFSERPYQGRIRVEASVERLRAPVEVPAGALWVPADQPRFEIAVQLLEPEAPDSLLRWGDLDTVFERKEYIDPRVLEEIARDMLDASPALSREWREALEDPAFAADPWARHLWWYRRTPFWDDTVGLLPYVRALEVPDELRRRRPGRVDGGDGGTAATGR